MWTCKQCGEKLEDQFDSCWRCSSLKPTGETAAASAAEPGAEKPPQWRLAYRVFRGTLATWDDLFTQAARFATEVGPERVVNISHSADDQDGVVAVWYWTTEGEAEPG
jgi:hypothetical protein